MEKEMLIWVARQLFVRRMTPGTTGNISLFTGDEIIISSSGSCFGTLSEEQLCRLSLNGERLSIIDPSKEAPIHLMLHRLYGEKGVVIHTHGFYTTAWSCLPCMNEDDAIPSYTPYLRMKAGRVRYIEYEKPGSEELFNRFQEALEKTVSVYLLAHHGAVVWAPTAMEAFNLIEETEESAHMAWVLQGTLASEIM